VVTPIERYEAALSIVPLVAGGDAPPAWSPDGSALVVLDHRPGRNGLRHCSTDGEQRLLVGADSLAQLLAVPVGGLAAATLSWVDGTTVAVDVGTSRVLVDTVTATARAEDGASREQRLALRPRLLRRHLLTGQPPVMEQLSPDAEWFATEQDSGIWLRSPDGEARALTKGEGWDLEHASWSPDSRQLFVLRQDESGVPRLPIVDYAGVHEGVTEHAYPRSGDPFPCTTGHLLGVDGAVLDVDLGAGELFWIEPAGWTDAGELLLLVSPRDNKTLELRAVDRLTGATRVVVTESQDTFVYGIRIAFITTSVHLIGDELMWMSERDGFRHVYRYTLAGECLGQLTSGPFEVDRVVGVTGTGQLLVLAQSDLARPYDVHLCSVSLDGSGFRQLTQQPGQHQSWLSPDGEHVVVGHSSLFRVPVSDLRTTDGLFVTRVNEAHDGLTARLTRPAVEELTFDLGDGQPTRHGVLLHPPGFDASGSYPLVELVYGGPQNIAHPRDFRHSANVLAQALTQLGLVVLVVDGTGTPGRGKAFQDVVHGRFGRHQVQEHGRLLEHLLAELPYIDRDRIGVVGGSWGGYAALRLLLDRPDLYRAAAALYGVSDLYDHLARAIEPYMGTPQQNPSGYRDAELLGRLGELDGRLLLLHGTADANATISACMKTVTALMEADKEFDLLVVPGMEHAFVGPGAMYALRRVARFFLDTFGEPRDH
jgi:dipeptidyl aminopeptidase/acylaminoacyl peptidase